MVWRDGYEVVAANGHGFLNRPEEFRKRTDAHAGASLYTTATDYARFVCSVLNDEGLERETIEEMLTPQIVVDDSVSWSLGFGIQRDINGDAFWQWGDYGIFRSYIIAYRKQKSGGVYLTNSYYGLSIAPDLVGRAIGGAHLGLNWLDYESFDSPRATFVWTTMEEGAAAAIALFPELRAKDPEAFEEGDINRLGYGFLSVERFDDAIALFRLNVDEHPLSANTYDSLGEAYMSRGADEDIELAIASYELALEKILTDPNTDEGFRESLRTNAEAKLAELREMLRDE
jgi:tetratricopeptide (TPR) repeat protein